MKAGVLYSGNGYALSMLGGYAVKSVTDSSRHFVDYASVGTMAAWADISTNGAKWQGALFGGFSRNLGANSNVIGPYYSRGSNISYLYRIAPRVYLTVNKIRFGAEVEYTAAAYGTISKNAIVQNSQEVGNWRFLFAVYYIF
jgi:hypothetical protein